MAASRATSSFGSGRLDDVSQYDLFEVGRELVSERKRFQADVSSTNIQERRHLLGDKDASGGRVEILSIDAVDLVTSIQVGGALTKGVLLRVGENNVETL